MKRRVLSFLLVLAMLLSTVGQGSIYLAEETEDTVTSSPIIVSDTDSETTEIKDVIVINPFAEEIYSEEAIDEMVAALEQAVEENKKEDHYADNVDLSSTVYTDLEDAAEYLREQMVARDEVAEVTVDMSAMGTVDFYDTYPLLWDAAVAYSEECTGQEGDALALGWATYSVGGSYGSGDNVTIEFTVTWRTTAAQEAELTTAVDAALEELALDGQTDYQKARAIYDFVCDTVDYDYEHLNSDEDYPLMYTSYAAMCNGTSVCQGYALLYYRMCKDAGLSARYIRGYASGGNHGWNIVRIGDVYYNADTTWDGQDEASYHNYFLQNMTDFTDHTRRDEYATDEFMTEFPMAADSWSDYSNLSEATTFENYDTVTFNTVDGKTATNTANGKVKLLVFGRVTCTYTRNTISNLSQGDFNDIDIIYCDFDQNDLATVTEFRDTYGSSTDGIAYAYAEDYSIYYLMWDYVGLYSDSGSVSLPVLVFINEDNEVAHYTAGGTKTASYVRTCIDTYLGDYELIEISDKTLTMNEGETKTPQITIQGIVRNNQFLTWSSSNTSVTTVDATGKITAKAAGTATITCKANDEVYVTCQITVIGDGLNKASDGFWYYYKDGVIDTSYTGFATNKNGTFYVVNGKVSSQTTGVIKVNGEWYYIIKGTLQTNYTGFATNKSGTWYISNGKVNFSKTGVIKVNGEWYYILKGALQTNYTGFASNSSGTWYILNGKVIFTKNGVIKVHGEWYYVVKGALQTNYTGFANNSNGTWYILNGKVIFTKNGVIKVNGEWYYVVNGALQTNYTGIQKNSNGSWYIKDGKVDFSFTGILTFDGTTYNIKNGMVIE